MRLYTQAELDAEADAETLRRVMFEICGGDPYPLLTQNANVAAAVASGRFDYATCPEPWNTAAFHAIWAARHAFNAVPALRVPDFESEEDKNG